jgi:hypothetical protein
MNNVKPVFEAIQYGEQSLGLADQFMYLFFYKTCMLDILIKEDALAKFHGLKGC